MDELELDGAPEDDDSRQRARSSRRGSTRLCGSPPGRSSPSAIAATVVLGSRSFSTSPRRA